MQGFSYSTIGPDCGVTPLMSQTIVGGMNVAFIDLTLFELKVYFYTDGETELERRSTRDVAERGTKIDYLRHSHE
jgi:uridine kinase